ncbi:RNA polymerase, sigma-24 subunit, ECF subfamily [Xylanimonas cellulosilytica DSM 15894]|uniref:RNA polymerase, sigma-24 subunit, ECF subfamily n=1 Tax=Xylanimonas cellulosilytica (strain DSM 15894 / JCM 12276 / CECT 5975 / KCTC 9989 / LMG 20990 / NBRC 107835 / XIL07) TaxID=446471 RepID=D1BTC8_XYLCX|nr:sigma-70 family RNA polymerase sigma factor [Xylanimonas cellulosilytica]ACZ29070.1 RNA polymerase, sigma-24 subunit, ECF subfamily [Xylanimonas cellulosilytica DSM 15894]
MQDETRDEASFTTAFRASYDDVRAFLARRVDPQAAEDLTAEVFTRAWNTWHRSPIPPQPWLFGIARHLVVDRYRDTERRQRLQSRMENDRPLDLDEARAIDTSLDFRHAWAQLSDRDREVLALIAWDGLSVTDAATVIGTTRAAYSVRLTRARRRLAHLLDQAGPTTASATRCTTVERSRV